MLEYDFELIHRPGVQLAYAMSRAPIDDAQVIEGVGDRVMHIDDAAQIRTNYVLDGSRLFRMMKGERKGSLWPRQDYRVPGEEVLVPSHAKLPEVVHCSVHRMLLQQAAGWCDRRASAHQRHCADSISDNPHRPSGKVSQKQLRQYAHHRHRRRVFQIHSRESCQDDENSASADYDA